MCQRTREFQITLQYLQLDPVLTCSISVVVPAILAIISMFATPCLSWIFEDREVEARSFSSGTSTFIKHLIEHQSDNVKAVIQSVSNISETMTFFQGLELPREERREKNKLFVSCLQELKGSNKAFIWMKKNIAHETCNKILKDYEYSGTWLETKADEAEDLLNSSKRAFQNLRFKKTCTICQPLPGCSCCQRYCGFCQNPRTITCNISCRTQEGGRFDFYTIAHSFARVLANYLDLTKDTALLMEMMLVVQAGLFLKFGTFPSAIAWILVASIVLPLLFSAVETAKNRPTIILGSSGWQRFEENPPSKCKIWLLRILIIVFYPAVPAINICAREAAKAKKEKLLEKTRIEFSEEDATIHREVLERLAQVEKYLVEVRKGIMTFKLNELSWEMPLQIGLQLIMLLLSTSFTITHAGMQALFQEDFKVSLTGDLCIGCPIFCHSIEYNLFPGRAKSD